MIPQNRQSTTKIVGTILAPKERDRNLLVDYSRGGAAMGDTSQGINFQSWRCWYDNGRVNIRGLTNGSGGTVLTIPNVVELSFTFDRNMDGVLAYVQNGFTCLLWYDPAIPGYTTDTFGDAYSPMLVHDDVRDLTSPVDDVLLFYVRTDYMVCYRQQRDRYAVEIPFAQMPSGYRRINKIGMTEKLRLQVEVVKDQF